MTVETQVPATEDKSSTLDRLVATLSDAVIQTKATDLIGFLSFLGLVAMFLL